MRLSLNGGFSIAACAGLLLGLAILPSEAREHWVACDYGQSIQYKLNSRAESGDTINIRGNCNGNVVIHIDNITLNCRNAAIISSSSRHTINVRTTDVKIANCKITGNPADGVGVMANRSSSAVLTDNEISGARTGAVITQSSYARLEGSAAAPSAPSQSITSANNGVVISNSSSADLFRNDISDNARNGVLILRSSSADIVGNDINNNCFRGVGAFQSSVVDFSNDIIFGKEANRISGNTGFGITCSGNGAVGFGVAQDFGSGNGNGGVENFSPADCSYNTP